MTAAAPIVLPTVLRTSRTQRQVMDEIQPRPRTSHPDIEALFTELERKLPEINAAIAGAFEKHPSIVSFREPPEVALIRIMMEDRKSPNNLSQPININELLEPKVTEHVSNARVYNIERVTSGPYTLVVDFVRDGKKGLPGVVLNVFKQKDEDNRSKSLSSDELAAINSILGRRIRLCNQDSDSLSKPYKFSIAEFSQNKDGSTNCLTTQIGKVLKSKDFESVSFASGTVLLPQASIKLHSPQAPRESKPPVLVIN